MASHTTDESHGIGRQQRICKNGCTLGEGCEAPHEGGPASKGENDPGGLQLPCSFWLPAGLEGLPVLLPYAASSNRTMIACGACISISSQVLDCKTQSCTTS